MKNSLLFILSILLLSALATACDDEKSSNAGLADVTLGSTAVSGITLNSTETNYNITTAGSATNIDITPTAADPSATLRIRSAHGSTTNWTAIASGSTMSFALVGEGYIRRYTYGNIVDIEVTAEDGTMKTYTLTFMETNG